jgi:TolA-binding protein
MAESGDTRRNLFPMPVATPARRTALGLALWATLTAGGLCAVAANAERADPQSAPAPTAATPPTATRPASDAVTRIPARVPEPAIDPQVAELGHTVAALSGDLERLQDDNERLQHANQRLNELNAQLRQEVESLSLELQAARARANQRWVLYGAGLVFLGLLTGVLIKARPRRSAWN